MLTLNIALITHGPQGLLKASGTILPPSKNITYIISWQNHLNTQIPDFLLHRPDIKIYRLDTPGLSANRNNAIAHCTGDIILLADNDITYSPPSLTQVIQTFTQNPDLDVATFHCQFGNKPPILNTPTHLSIPLPKNYTVASVEIALRRSSAGHLRCCPEMGLGSPKYHGGEDELLLLTAIKKHLGCQYFPITICTHPEVSTGTKTQPTPQNLQASGIVIALTYPYTFLPRIILKTFRLHKTAHCKFINTFYHLIKGAFNAPALLHRNHNTLW